jgi:hypothetical protein
VWFFSLDAGQRLAVRVARQFFHLPHFDAKFQIGRKVKSSNTPPYACIVMPRRLRLLRPIEPSDRCSTPRREAWTPGLPIAIACPP